MEKLVYGGDGLTRLPDGKAVFLPFVLPGEEVSATVVQEKSSFARASLDEVLKPSHHRITAHCPYFANCGGCNYQHAGYATQLEIKRDILRETLLRNGKLEWKKEITTHSGDQWNYRNRTRMKVRGGAQFALGYHRFASHDLLPVKNCPISSPLINRAIAKLWEMGATGVAPEGINEIEFFADHADSRLVLEIYSSPSAERVHEFAGALQTAMAEIRGIAIFAQSTDTRGGLHPPHLRDSVGNATLTYQVADKPFRVSAGSFFQVNRHLVRKLVDLVTGDFSGKIALDLYSGVGLFANHLAKRFAQVFAVESAPASAADLEANALKNVTPVRSPTEKFLPRCLNLHPDLVVVDPPRAGLGTKPSQLLASLRVPRIVYVSCDPATLARDVRLLLETGYHVEQVHLVDLFPQTFHIESVVRLAR